jgi:hypothetical protein
MPYLAICSILMFASTADARDTRPTTQAVRQKALLEELAGQGEILFGAYNENRRWDAYVMRADGTNVRNLTRTDDFNEYLPRAAPGTRRVYFVRIPFNDPAPRILPFRNFSHLPWEWEGHLFVTDPTGTAHAPVTARAAGGQRDPVTEASGLAAIDADTVAFGDVWSQRIVVLNAKTGEKESYPVKGPPRHLSASPDGRYIWFAAPLVDWRLFRLDRRTGETEDLGGGDFFWPAVSHDGTRVVHAVQKRPDLTGGLADRCLVVRDADGGRLRLLIGEPGSEVSCPAWGPDDKYLVYSIRLGTEPVTLRVTRLADLLTVPLAARRGNCIDPCWLLPARPTTQPDPVSESANERNRR